MQIKKLTKNKKNLENLLQLDNEIFQNKLNLDFLSNKKISIFIIKNINVIISYLIVFQNDIFEYEIIRIWVHEDFQKKKIGSRLFHHFENKLKPKLIFLEVDKTNEKAIFFYKYLDFLVISERTRYYANGHDALVLKKEFH